VEINGPDGGHSSVQVVEYQMFTLPPIHRDAISVPQPRVQTLPVCSALSFSGTSWEKMCSLPSRMA
jgi:hypothetical protein